MLASLPLVGSLHISRLTPSPASHPSFVLADRYGHGVEYTFGIGRWPGDFTPAASVTPLKGRLRSARVTSGAESRGESR